MRKRFALLWALVVLGAALALPVTTAAASGYTYKTVWNYCSGYQVNLKMKDMAAGYTPANKLVIRSWAQRHTGSGWHTVYTWANSVYTFNANGQKHILTAWRSYNGNAAYFYRIIFELQAWHNNTLLADSSFRSVKC